MKHPRKVSSSRGVLAVGLAPLASIATVVAQRAPQAGVTHTFLQVEDASIQGNGHMMMLEKNSAQIAARLQQWIVEHVK